MSYVLPLGPFHPAMRTPLRIALRAEGELVDDIEYRDGYNARDVADRVRRADPAHAYDRIARACGTHALHHMLAWTLALENLVGAEAPPRAQALRTIAAELERAASHLQHAAIVFELLGLDSPRRELAGLRELALNALRSLTGSRLAARYPLPLGVASDVSNEARRREAGLLRRGADALFQLTERTIRQRAFTRRVLGVGVLTERAAVELSIAGLAGRASGRAVDVRVDRPYAAYAGRKTAPVLQPGGDVYARIMLLLLEAYDSLRLAYSLLDALPEGPCIGERVEVLPPGTGEAEVEAPSFPLRYRVVSDGTRARELTVEALGAPHRLVWRALLVGNLVDDAAIIVASLGACTTCAEQ